MSRSRALFAVAVAAGLLLAVLLRPTSVGASDGAAARAWTDAELDRASTLPLQDGGRIKPLDSFARVTLLRLNHKRSCADADGRSLGAMEWLFEVLFRPARARRIPCFLVEDSQVLDAIGFAHEGKKRRDRYTFDDLAPVRGRLGELAHSYMKVESRNRTQVENGVVDLYGDLETFDGLSHYLDFARSGIVVPDAERVRAIWPGRETVSAIEVLDRMAELDALVPNADPHAGVPGAPQSAAAEASPEARAAAGVRGRAIDALEAATALALIPPDEPRDAAPTWRTPGQALFEAAVGRSAGSGAVVLARRLGTMTSSVDDPTAFERELAAFHDGAVASARARGEYEKVPLEVSLTRLDPFYRAIYLYLLAFLLLAASWAWPNRWLVRGVWTLLLAGLALHVAGIVVRCVLRDRPPISTLYDTTLFIALMAVGGCLVAERMQRRGVALALAPVLGALLLFVGQRFEVLKGEDTLPQLVAVLDTNFWLALHVTCITIGYSGGLLASAVGHVHVLGRTVGLKRDDPGFYALLHRMTYGMLCFGLLFSVVGTILGGIWANESWGRFWGWDPKENGALLICISQLAILHARLGGLLKPFGIAVASILCGCVVAFSWWGVNLLGIGLHSYGFTGGIMRGLTIFYAVEVAVLGAAAATRLTGRHQDAPSRSREA